MSSKLCKITPSPQPALSGRISWQREQDQNLQKPERPCIMFAKQRGVSANKKVG